MYSNAVWANDRTGTSRADRHPHHWRSTRRLHDANGDNKMQAKCISKNKIISGPLSWYIIRLKFTWSNNLRIQFDKITIWKYYIKEHNSGKPTFTKHTTVLASMSKCYKNILFIGLTIPRINPRRRQLSYRVMVDISPSRSPMEIMRTSTHALFDFIECFTTTFLRAHSWLNWVDTSTHEIAHVLTHYVYYHIHVANITIGVEL